ncbi:succinate-semialdehyde dehydrogenase [Agrobacterium tumefaciens]|nr:succinate-semialdehyde dehydrogenase [Agrobacterium tumefaciens]
MNDSFDAVVSDRGLLKDAAFIDGHWRDESNSRKTFDVVNPATGTVIATLPDMSAFETRLAIEAADASRPAWAAAPAKERAAILRAFSTLMVENADDLAAILTSEMGKPFSEARAEVLYGASYLEWFGEEAKRVYGDTIPGYRANNRILVLKQPIGTVAAITPWNFPNAMIARKLGPALAAGCSIVLKPAAETPLSALAIAELSVRAGLPKGLFNVVLSTDAAGVGREMCENVKVRKLTFTGSTNVGKILMRQGAENVLRVSLELGGNAPLIVFNDADLEIAVEGTIASKYRNNGQTCVCSNRIFVQRDIYDVFVDKLAAKVSQLKVGNGLERDISAGPMISKKALTKVEDHVRDAIENGAKVVVGGKQHKLGGLFYEPTVLSNVDDSMLIAKEETFGPVAPVFCFDSVEEVIARANNTEFGLASYFFTRDLSKALKVAEALECGMVGVNTGSISTESAPFGGVKQSGLGREGSKYGIEDYLETKYVCLDI